MKSKIIPLTSLWRWLDRWQPSEALVLSGVAVLVGLTAGAGVWLFKQLIELVHFALFDQAGAALAPWGGWTLALLPIAGGLVVGLLLHYLVGEERHHGVAGIMEAVALAGGRLRYRRMPVKTLAAAISIGGGASVGPEDPSVQIGANLGSMFGQWLRLSDELVRALVAAGAAAGIAAAFNAPIAGVFFALEIILGEISGGAFGVVVLAAVVAAVFTQGVSGSQPAFRVPPYAFNSAWELPLYLGLGLLAGPIAAVYIRLLYLAQDIFHPWSLPRWLKPAVAGFIVGVVGVELPQILGVGYETIEEILKGEHFTFWLLGALLITKLVLTPVSIGGGFPGGVFAPSLFLGATLGAAYGQVAQKLLPTLGIVPPAFAMVGMAAVLAGAVHAPLTAIILLFEMTSNYRIILPVMFAVVVSLLLSQRLQRDSVYSLGLARKGVRIQRGRDVEVLEAMTVGEVMQTNTPTLYELDTLGTALDRLLKLRRHGLPVLNSAGELDGIITLQDIDRAQIEDLEVSKKRRVGDIATHDLLVAYPDETLGAALQRMSVRDVGNLPVVARDRPRRLLGILRRADLVRAYNVALARRAAMRHKAQQVRLGAFSGANVEEVVISAAAPCEGQLISAVAWPRDCVIASIRRGQQTLIPHGDTVLKAGDVLVAVVEGEARTTLLEFCRTPKAE